MTDADLKRIRERCDKATPGPWECYTENTYSGVESPKSKVVYRSSGHAHDNMLFIAAARTDVPALVDEVKSERHRAETWKRNCVNQIEDVEVSMKERDEARAEVERYRGCPTWDELNDYQAKTMAELLEARAEVERLQILLRAIRQELGSASVWRSVPLTKAWQIVKDALRE